MMTSCSDVSSADRLRVSLLYAAPYLVSAFLYAPISILQGVYAQYYGISLTAIALAVLISRVFDAVTDPLAGIFSDRIFQRWRTRKPMIIVGALVLVLSGFFLYFPPADIDAIYFGGFLLLFYLGWTLFEIPHLSWGGECSADAIHRHQTYSIRVGVGYLGLILFYLIPLLPVFETSEITPETLRWSAFVALAAMPILLFVAVRHVPNMSVENNSSRSSCNDQQIASAYHSIKCAIHDYQYCIFLAAFLLSYIGLGMWYGLIFIFVSSYLGMGDQFSAMFLGAFFVGLAVTPIWYSIGRKIGRKSSWLLALLIIVIAFVMTGLANPSNVSLTNLFLLKSLSTIGFVSISIIAPGYVSDLAARRKHSASTNITGFYFAVYTFANKAGIAVGGAMALAIAGVYGFDATQSGHTGQAVVGIRIAVAWLPIIFVSLSAGLILLLDRDKERET